MDEVKLAELNVFRMVQWEAFSVNEDVISGLRVHRDQDGLIRVKTKLVYREDTKEFRWPILQPHAHSLVDHLILDEHLTHRHTNAQYLMRKLRERCWTVPSRHAIRRMLSRCVKCFHFTSRKGEVAPAPLSEDWVKNAKVFQVVGMDLAEPLFLKGGTKAWVVLFTCAIN